MEDWTNLARWLVRARGDRSQPEVAEAAGVGLTTIQKYESGRRAARGGRMLRRLAAYYGWTPDSLDRVLAGEEPISTGTLTATLPAVQGSLQALAGPTPPALKSRFLELVETDPAFAHLTPADKRRIKRKIQAMPEE